MSESIENPQAEILFGDIVEYIESVQKLMAADQIRSLDQFDTVVDDLSARIVKLSPDVIENYQPEMEYVTEQLRNLTAAMMESGKAMAHDLDVVEKRLKAIRAYYVTPAEGE